MRLNTHPQEIVPNRIEHAMQRGNHTLTSSPSTLSASIAAFSGKNLLKQAYVLNNSEQKQSISI